MKGTNKNKQPIGALCTVQCAAGGATGTRRCGRPTTALKTRVEPKAWSSEKLRGSCVGSRRNCQIKSSSRRTMPSYALNQFFDLDDVLCKVYLDLYKLKTTWLFWDRSRSEMCMHYVLVRFLSMHSNALCRKGVMPNAKSWRVKLDDNWSSLLNEIQLARNFPTREGTWPTSERLFIAISHYGNVVLFLHALRVSRTTWKHQCFWHCWDSKRKYFNFALFLNVNKSIARSYRFKVIFPFFSLLSLNLNLECVWSEGKLMFKIWNRGLYCCCNQLCLQMDVFDS